MPSPRGQRRVHLRMGLSSSSDRAPGSGPVFSTSVCAGEEMPGAALLGQMPL